MIAEAIAYGIGAVLVYALAVRVGIPAKASAILAVLLMAYLAVAS